MIQNESGKVNSQKGKSRRNFNSIHQFGLYRGPWIYIQQDKYLDMVDVEFTWNSGDMYQSLHRAISAGLMQVPSITQPLSGTSNHQQLSDQLHTPYTVQLSLLCTSFPWTQTFFTFRSSPLHIHF